jgi:hypothetical protein
MHEPSIVSQGLQIKSMALQYELPNLSYKNPCNACTELCCIDRPSGSVYTTEFRARVGDACAWGYPQVFATTRSVSSDVYRLLGSSQRYSVLVHRHGNYLEQGITGYESWYWRNEATGKEIILTSAITSAFPHVLESAISRPL